MAQCDIERRHEFQILEDRHLLSAAGFVERDLITLSHRTESISLADFNNDGLSAILASGFTDLGPGPGGMSVHREWIDNTAAGLQPISDDDKIWSLVADLDGDGFEDIVAASYFSDRLTWYQNSGDGRFREPVEILKRFSWLAAAADIDSDGDDDLILASTGPSFCHTPGSCELVLLINDNLTFRQEIISDDSPAKLVLSDVDGDQDDDLVTLQTDGNIVWFENVDGKGSFVRSELEIHSGFSRVDWNDPDLSAADIDGDGDNDLVMGTGSVASWFENTGGGTFAPRSEWEPDVGHFFGDIRPADMDRDGDQDLVVASSRFGNEKGFAISWIENRDGRGDFSGVPNYLTRSLSRGFGIWDLVVEDVDLDDDMDVIVSTSVPADWAETGNLGGVLWFESRPVGDVTNDGVFDSSDLVKVFQAGKYEDGIPNNSTFDTGDWNGDGEFDSSDLVLAFQAGHYETVAKPLAAEIAAAVDWLFSQDDEAKKSRAFVA